MSIMIKAERLQKISNSTSKYFIDDIYKNYTVKKDIDDDEEFKNNQNVKD